MSTATHMRPAVIAASIVWACIAAPATAQSRGEGGACEREIEHKGTVELAVGSNSGQDTFGPYGDARLRIDMLDVRLRADTLAEAWVEPVDNGRDRSLDVSGARASLPPDRQRRMYVASGTRVTLTLVRSLPTHVINTADYTVRGCLLPPTPAIGRTRLDIPRRAPRVLSPREPVEQRAVPRQRPVGNR